MTKSSTQNVFCITLSNLNTQVKLASVNQKLILLLKRLCESEMVNTNIIVFTNEKRIFVSKNPQIPIIPGAYFCCFNVSSYVPNKYFLANNYKVYSIKMHSSEVMFHLEQINSSTTIRILIIITRFTTNHNENKDDAYSDSNALYKLLL